VGIAFVALWLGCSSGRGQQCGGDAGACASGNACITGGVCAPRCDGDGAATCPIGESCQAREGYCTGTACAAIQVKVCL
jgi:hypothetical protein